MTTYSIIRCCISLVITVIVFILVIRKLPKRSCMLLMVIPTAVWLLSYIALSLFPVENLLFGFNSPEEAFEYRHDDEILEIFEQDNYSLVISKENNNSDIDLYYYIIPKEDGVWKLENMFTYRADIKVVGSCMIHTMYIPKCNDCVVFVQGYVNEFSLATLSSTTDDIYDTIGTDFQKLDYVGSGAFYYGLIKNIDENYRLYVDDTEIEIDVD